jgi:hypothetical protein
MINKFVRMSSSKDWDAEPCVEEVEGEVQGGYFKLMNGTRYVMDAVGLCPTGRPRTSSPIAAQEKAQAANSPSADARLFLGHHSRRPPSDASLAHGQPSLPKPSGHLPPEVLPRDVAGPLLRPRPLPTYRLRGARVRQRSRSRCPRHEDAQQRAVGSPDHPGVPVLQRQGRGLPSQGRRDRRTGKLSEDGLLPPRRMRSRRSY